jgi:hypothetical protein
MGGGYFNKKILKRNVIRNREPQPNQLGLSLRHPHDVDIPKLQRDNEKKV